MERIARRSDRSTAHIENGLVKIVRRVGKWKLFGSSNHLKWHEAMYLIEVVRRHCTCKCKQFHRLIYYFVHRIA